MKTFPLFLIFVCYSLNAQNLELDKQGGALYQSDDDSFVFRVGVEQVNISFSAFDNKGAILDLTTDQVRVVEIVTRNGRKQEIERIPDYFNKSQDLPLRLGLLIDSSGSSGVPNSYSDALRGFKDPSRSVLKRGGLIASQTIATIWELLKNDNGNNNKIFLGEIGYEGDGEPNFFTLRTDWTSNISKVVNTISKQKSGGSSPLFAAVLGAAIQQFGQNSDINSEDCASLLIVISDGQNTLSTNGLAPISYAQAINLPIYTIAVIPDYYDVITRRQFISNLKSLSDQTGGQFNELPGPNKIADIAHRIARNFRDRYYIGYPLDPDYNDLPSNNDFIELRVEIGSADFNGEWRKRKDVTVFHKSGYFVNPRVIVE
ncbi:MAG: hypothetical protein COV29_02755 [Candidatus Yanofskybacteria bacterium CG10_big_fil_rev_8_21_14_0_10_36_16]|uniref:VWFA domain-containing protein n=1 Tax=Candidatus Yanofskybacteria bacterium CG10_big_fil_rev_8_21_14_0_10_36_16 TaxID=1975096 RepID=A0A2J0QBJ3_9BACT|nr:MAG: hypothetical protein COV29_02755 [Candidatus Yanofskybacteria bacterium CG10_big_fil_rev_8_21_14_0_10_36_16]